MRRTLTAALLLIALIACGDGEGERGAYIRASFDGRTWNAEATEGEIASRQIGAGSQFIALVLPMPPDLGTHALDESTAKVSFGSCPDDILADCIG